MNSGSIRAALFALALATPALMLAGGQPDRVPMVTRVELQHRDVMSRAINQGKGSGVTRRQVTERINSRARSTGSDTAFSK